jgi:hypothetical protein
MAFANVVPAKFIELNASVSGVGLIPAPRESVPVFNRESVVVEAIAASSPIFPCGSHASRTVSTSKADGSGAVFVSAAPSGEIFTCAASSPKNSRTVSTKPWPDAPEALALIARARPMIRQVIVLGRSVECDEDALTAMRYSPPGRSGPKKKATD